MAQTHVLGVWGRSRKERVPGGGLGEPGCIQPLNVCPSPPEVAQLAPPLALVWAAPAALGSQTVSVSLCLESSLHCLSPAFETHLLKGFRSPESKDQRQPFSKWSVNIC